MKLISWAQLVLGIWMIVSPWILSYWRITSALWSAVVAGVIVALLALWQIVGIDEHNNENR